MSAYKRSHQSRPFAPLLVGLAALMLCAGLPVGATTISPAFRTLWGQTDQDPGAVPVWGPEAFTDELNEAYAEAPGGNRIVQYFDKGRMEFGGMPQAPTITAGLLATELITGKTQTGNASSKSEGAARVPVVGDPTNTWPTYASLDVLRTMKNDGNGPVSRFYNPDGKFTTLPDAANDPLAAYASTDSVTGHSLPKAFDDFRNDPRHPLATVGLAITEPTWAKVAVGGQPKTVLVQAFERRVLTDTPSNADPYKVEFGNIGQHYYRWRYSKSGGNETPIVSGVAPEFRPAYSSGYGMGLGKPTIPNASSAEAVSVVEMDQGYMLYVASTKKIYTLPFDHRSVGVYDDTWAEGQDPGGKPGPRGNLVEPSRGFGKVWRENPSVQLALGYARGPEQGTNGQIQAYEHGFIYYDTGSKDFWLINLQTNDWSRSQFQRH